MSQLLDQVRDEITKRTYRPKTGEAYILWIKRFIIFNGKKHPKDMNETHIQKYLDYLTLQKDYSHQHKVLRLIQLCFYTSI